MSGIIGGAGSNSGKIDKQLEVSRQEVKFPLRVRGGSQIVVSGTPATFPYTAGDTYIVEVACNAGTAYTVSDGEEIYRINPDSSVEELASYTGTIAASISVVGTLIITCTGQRGVQSLMMYRIG